MRNEETRDEIRVTPVDEAILAPHPNASHDEATVNGDDEETPRIKRSERIAQLPRANDTRTAGSLATRSQEEQQEYVVDKIVAHREEGDGTFSYLVKWYGYSTDQNTWEPITNLRRSMIERYCRKRRIQCPEDLDLAIEG